MASRLRDSLAELLKSRGIATPPRPSAPEMEIADGHAFWLDAAYLDAQGQEHVMGGMNGRLRLRFPEPPPESWLRQAILGQYAGMGQRVAFGFGRYRLETPDGEFTLPRASPAASLLTLAREESNLIEAWRHIAADRGGEREWSDAAVWDETDAAERAEANEDISLERLQAALDRALIGDYRPPPLRGHLLPKSDGGLRPLAVPPLFDHALQRAVAQILTPALEAAQYRHSYGYRRGRSRQGARDAVQAASREGYDWVYESDIEDFFDTVTFERLEARLSALYGEDPAVRLILDWMRRPVEYRGRTVERECGLPQGSPLSPAMANLMLDDFDGDMEVQGYRLIRFADDFVVLCKTREQAESAHRAAVASLAEHGLALNAEKTRIAAMKDGFRYLGYLFVNDLAVDVSGHAEETQGPPRIPPHSWLARAGLDQAPAPAEATTDASADAKETAAIRHIGEMDEGGQLLCIAGEPAALSTRMDRLTVARGDAILYDLPWRHVRAVILFGPHSVTVPAMNVALQRGVPLHFAGRVGAYRGVLWNGRPDPAGAGLWLRQASLFADPALALSLAKEIVAARIRHQRETLRRRGASAAAESLERRLESVERAGDSSALNGCEGAAARDYFQALAELLDPAWGFDGRNRRPPLDPFNALLSLGYTLLHGYAETMLHADGLLPWLGFYHRAHGAHATLASDLMEPFRHLVERAALAVVQRRELRPADFFKRADGACLARPEARRLYLARVLERLETPVTALHETEAPTPLQHLHRQNLSLIRWLTCGEPFRPWKAR